MVHITPTMYKIILLSLAISVLFASCAKEKGKIEVKSIDTDAKLYAYMVSFATAKKYTYYQNQAQITSTSGFHNGSYVLKFNPKAQSALGADGKLPQGSTFPDSSIVVKELYNGGTTPYLYNIIMKNKTNPLAKNGWLWAEYKPDGGVNVSITSLGSTCLGCHGGNRDYVLTFDAHP